MAQLTSAQMRAIVQRLVQDTNTTSPGLSSADYTELINDAMFAYADMFPDSMPLSGIVGQVSIAAGNTSKQVLFTTTPPVVRSITGAFVLTHGPMQKRNPLDILRMINDQPLPTGQPSQFSFESLLPGDKSGLAGIMRFWPISDGTYTVNLFGTVQPVPLAVDADYTVYQDTECRIIARMAAVEAARLLGRTQEFISGIAGLLPDALKAQYGAMKRDVQPGFYEGKPVA